MAQGDYAGQAKQILDGAGFEGGIIVHLGCGDGTLTAALRADKNCIVHGLDADAQTVQAAREYVREQGIYGPVSIDHLAGASLPYADNLVNLVVGASPESGPETKGDHTGSPLQGVAMDELMRVLAPGGVLYAHENGRWRKTVKQRPQNIDEWTHYLHDPSGNAVAHDDIVGPPRHIQWVDGPRYDRSHEHTPNLYALVSTGGNATMAAHSTRRLQRDTALEEGSHCVVSAHRQLGGYPPSTPAKTGGRRRPRLCHSWHPRARDRDRRRDGADHQALRRN
jgi:SAM-dependent methyltransferase